MLGILLAIAAACSYSVSAVLARLGLQGGIRTSTGTFISSLSSLALIGTLALIINFDDLWDLAPEAIMWFALIGLINYVLGRQFNYGSIQRIGVSRAAPLFASSPLFAFLLAVIFLGEQPNPALIIGTLIIVGGLYLVVTSRE